MKSSTLTASEQLAQALENIKGAQRALKLTGEQETSWLLMEALGRVKEASNAVEIAGAHVAELLEFENGGDTE